ncbi:MAG: fasciclin domain-containing protein [Okeania sp. SIO2F4]|uniref:fasciclin domain-containing protein n=1 Tax=Okeania sp. SIO2F4 TaxID=2607790 RepID=UPI00142A9CFB|nr:fasciclin domain-containing protein [Okeania sp. SIO2F4]NES04126.1 fasciclin domain-containing protein [Okeania sp. SIO2F4]
MNTKAVSSPMKKLTGLLLTIAASALISLPVLAQNYYSSAIFNPRRNSTSRSVDGTIAGEFDAAIKYYQNFQTFADAVNQAGLMEQFRSSNSRGAVEYTVFVPTDAAFAALPEATRKELFKPKNKEKLLKLLNYHIVPGAVSNEEVAEGMVETVSGDRITINLDAIEDKITLNESSTIESSQRAKNGVIILVDEVLIPEEL